MTAPIVIVSAMKSETDRIFAALENQKAASVSGFDAAEGELFGHPAVVARCSVGMVNAAILTTELIVRYAPRCVISQGTAGAHDRSLKIGDIVLCERALDSNTVLMRPEDCRRLTEITAGEWYEAMSCQSDKGLMEAALSIPYSGGKKIKGVVASGDFWSYGESAILAVKERFHSDCEDMETFAVAHTCSVHDIPFLGIRMISNNELTGEPFQPETCRKLQSYTLDVIRSLI